MTTTVTMPDSPSRLIVFRRLIRFIAASALAAWMLLQLLPFVPLRGFDPREGSWGYLLHEAFLRHLDFGREFVFTFGPWGFITGEFHPATYGVVLGAWTLLLAVYAAALWRLLARPPLPLGASLVLLYVIVALLGFWPYDPVLLLFPGVAYLVTRDADAPRVLRTITLAGLAFMSLTKFTVFTLAAVAIVAVSGERLSRRRPPFEALAFAAFVCVFWIVAGQPLLSLPAFLRNAFDLSAGYADAMQNLPPRFHDPVAPFVISAALFWIGSAAFEMRRDRARGIAFSAAMAGMLAIDFKLAFVRPDRGHTTTGYLALALLQLVYLGSIHGELRWRPLRAAVPQAIAGAGLALALAVCAGFPTGGASRLLLDQPRLAANRARLALRLPSLSHELKREHEARVQRMRERDPLPPIAGPADAIPSFQPLLIAYDVRLAMRPLFESYTAYTPHLQSLNADHLRGARAPRTILFDVQPIDGRLPATEDGASWPELARRYQVTGTSRSFLILERRIHPEPRRLRLIARTSGRMGETVRVPASVGPVVMVADVARSPRGALWNALYRSAPLRITATTVSGVKSWRLVAGCARSGFVVSPLVETREEFAAFMDGRPGRTVTSIVIDAADGSPSREWDAEVRFAFYEMSNGRHSSTARSN